MHLKREAFLKIHIRFLKIKCNVENSVPSVYKEINVMDGNALAIIIRDMDESK